MNTRTRSASGSQRFWESIWLQRWGTWKKVAIYIGMLGIGVPLKFCLIDRFLWILTRSPRSYVLYVDIERSPLEPPKPRPNTSSSRWLCLCTRRCLLCMSPGEPELWSIEWPQLYEVILIHPPNRTMKYNQHDHIMMILVYVILIVLCCGMLSMMSHVCIIRCANGVIPKSSIFFPVMHGTIFTILLELESSTFGKLPSYDLICITISKLRIYYSVSSIHRRFSVLVWNHFWKSLCSKAPGLVE